MTKWVRYTGSDEQIAEIESAPDGFACQFKHGDNNDTRYDVGIQRYIKNINISELSHYLICNPHPLADMICQQARTGQPVWVKEGIDCMKPFIYETNKPDWNIPNAEYSFTPFD